MALRQIVVFAGTAKGACLFHSDESRREWGMAGPHLSGWEVYSLAAVLRPETGRVRLLAGTSHMAYGPSIRVSDDWGDTWHQMLASPRYAGDAYGQGSSVKRIWQIVPGHPSEPDTFYAGVEDAGLFASRDGGTTWHLVEGLSDHCSRREWLAGKSGFGLHSILIDPADRRRLWVGVQGGGVFRTVDGGDSWVACAAGLPAAGSTVDRCVLKLALDPRHPGVLYLRHRQGVFRSTDGGESWTVFGQGLPGAFGFPLCVTHAGDAFTVPLESEGERYMTDGRLCLYRRREDGAAWEPLGRGLPEYPSYVSVLRDSLAVDTLDPPGVYFGTTAGELFFSADAGETWQALPGKLPRITTVKTWVESK
ncbi:MAG: exo-alpha-sialidase [Chloroflexi bacterium]|nr:exo-alpha-sialidase [Chloroflexota bacterium]